MARDTIRLTRFCRSSLELRSYSPVEEDNTIDQSFLLYYSSSVCLNWSGFMHLFLFNLYWVLYRAHEDGMILRSLECSYIMFYLTRGSIDAARIIYSCFDKLHIHSIFDMEDFVKTHLCKGCVFLRVRILRGVCLF